MLRIISTNGGTAASIIAEWKACDVWSGVDGNSFRLELLFQRGDVVGRTRCDAGLSAC